MPRVYGYRRPGTKPRSVSWDTLLPTSPHPCNTAVWSVLDRRRTFYPRLSAWFFVFLRMFLGSQMFFYGLGRSARRGSPLSAVTMSLQRMDLNVFPLRTRGFNWVQDYPYFR
ncbi:hypothetical protein [Mycobacterium sp. E136]|uniref:hypothetical protein n=1 Tax=Mycobacterium sp. E136 TaxID=1834125 RepID=UPI0012E7B660|nr:hypothetical protein [Mycobacterium sp. E136]